MKVTDEVYREYSQMVYKYLFSLTGDAHVAEEVTQETFYQAVRCAGRFDGSCRFSTWLCAIAKNQLNIDESILCHSVIQRNRRRWRKQEQKKRM